MKIFKKENGHTLLELVIVTVMLGGLLVFLWTSFLSINRTYIRADKKAQNLEEARLIINHITDNFQSYSRCRVDVKGAGGNRVKLTQIVPVPVADLLLDAEGFSTVQEVFFTDDLTVPVNPLDPPDVSKTVKMSYVETVAAIPAPAPGVIPEGKLTWEKKASVEIDTGISSFKVRQNGDLLEFKIEVLQKGHGVIADQLLEVGTTLNLQYMPTI